MEVSCGPTKTKRSLSVDVKIATSSSDAEEITGNAKHVYLPHLVVGKVLKNLKFKDLIQCSLVNKIWNHEARRLLRGKHKCALAVNLDKPPADEIIKLETTLTAAEWLLPYGSLSIRKREKYRHEEDFIVWWTPEECKLLESAIKNIILRAGPFEIVQLDITCRLFGAFIIKNFLAEVQKTVKVLIIKNLDGWNLFENASRLPELKKLEICSAARIFDPDVRSIQNFLKYSEKLESVGLMSCRWLWLLETFPPDRKLAVFKGFSVADMYKYRVVVAELAKQEPKLEKLLYPRQLYGYWASGRFDATRPISMSLLLSSRASLIELQVTYEVMQEVRRMKPFAAFENLRYLTVDAPSCSSYEDLDGDEIIAALCPKLEELKVNVHDRFDEELYYELF